MTAPDTKSLAVDTLVAADNLRDRTKQTGVGPSALGGCRRQVAMQLLSLDEPNKANCDRSASIKGTLIHEGLERAFEKVHGDKYAVEITVPGDEEIRIEPGHSDLYRPDTYSIVDWKTTLKKSLRFFPGEHRRWQLNWYANKAREIGLRVDKIEIVAIPLDGTFADIQVFEFPYSEEVFQESRQWMADVVSTVEAVEATGDLSFLPEPERPANNFCAPYCVFFGEGSCPGLPSNRK